MPERRQRHIRLAGTNPSVDHCTTFRLVATCSDGVVCRRSISVNVDIVPRPTRHENDLSNNASAARVDRTGLTACGPPRVNVDDGSARSLRLRVSRLVPGVPCLRRRVLRSLLAGTRHQPTAGQRRRIKHRGPERSVHHGARQLVTALRRLRLARSVGAMLDCLSVVLGERHAAAACKIQQTS